MKTKMDIVYTDDNYKILSFLRDNYLMLVFKKLIVPHTGCNCLGFIGKSVVTEKEKDGFISDGIKYFKKKYVSKGL